MDPNVSDYYRYFESPGLGQCSNGLGSYPIDRLAILTDWVENGKAPDVIKTGATLPMGIVQNNRSLCAYPKKAVYKGEGDIWAAESFDCA